MIPRAVSLSTIASFALMILLVAPVYAAPSMSVGSNANYNFSASLNTSQSCNASPLSYNQTACGPPVPEYHIYIIDYGGYCSTFSNSSGYCSFSPQNDTVQPNFPVVWSNYGQMPHGVATCDPANSPTLQACPAGNDISGLDSFNSGTINPQATFSHTFVAQGTYYYFDPIHPWIHGKVGVYMFALPPPQVSPSQMFSPFPVTVAGVLGWNVVGLDKNTAVLNVTHALGLTVDNIPIAPVTESGSFQQSIDLATRAQALGSTAEMIDNFALPLMGMLLTGSFTSPGPFVGSSNPFPSLDNMPTIYTVWWVNGPLSTGSPVQILAGYSSVQGDETVNLAGNLGSRSAWVVTSTVQESVSTIVPQSVSNPGSGPVNSNDANANIALRFDYDKSNDLLLASNDNAIVTTTASTVYLPGQLLCGQFGDCTTVNTPTTVTHVMTMKLTVSLTLASTNLSFSKRMSAAGQPSQNLMSMLQDLMTQPLLYTGAGVAAAAIGTAAVWLTKGRNRTQSPSLTSSPQQAAPPQ